MTERKPEIDVCVATYRRPDQLERLLEALVRQETGGLFTIRIHVADNDRNRSAEAVIRKMNAAGHDITYDVEPEQNISLARNRSIAPARGEYIATVDDDDCPAPDWLRMLYEAAVTHGAEVVHGRMQQTFPPEAPRSVREFHAFPDPPTGTTSGYVYYTCNSLFRRSLLDGMAQPFEPRFGRSGGGDTFFFVGLRNRGVKMIYCREAVVHTEVPPARSRVPWIVKRRFRHGYTARDLHGTRLTVRTTCLTLLSVTILSVIASIYLVGALFVFCGRVRRRAWQKAVLRMTSALLESASFAGKLASRLGIRFEEYRG
jgi:succinoglycan biosynthesis protein ExoM